VAEEPSVLVRHRRACAGFDAVVDLAADDPEAWDKPSPCERWTARDVVGHVTGTHEMLATGLDEPLVAKPSEADEMAARWRVARDAALRALTKPGALDRVIDTPVGGRAPVGRFLNIMTTDVLVHTWDLARAVGADERLDPELVERAHKAAIPAEEVLRASGMFGPAVDLGDHAGPQAQMLAFFGRDPRHATHGDTVTR